MMNEERIYEITEELKRKIAKDIVYSGRGAGIKNRDDMSLFLKIVDEVVIEKALSIKSGLPFKTRPSAIECKGNIVVGHHFINGVKRHILQITDLDGNINYYTDGVLEKPRSSKQMYYKREIMEEIRVLKKRLEDQRKELRVLQTDFYEKPTESKKQKIQRIQNSNTSLEIHIEKYEYRLVYSPF